MLLRVSETDLIRLVNRLIPIDHVIPKGCQDDFVYIVDMDNDCKQRAIKIISINAVPEMYSPVQGTFLPAEVAQEVGSYSVIIERELTIEDWRGFFRMFSCAYAFAYNIIALRSERIKGHPWRGGFSAMHFWDELLRYIPAEDYPTAMAMHYASPGFVRFKLDSGIAREVGRLVAKYSRDYEPIRNAMMNLYAVIRTNDLNNEKLGEDDPIWAKVNAELTKLTLVLLTKLELPSIREFLAAAERPFEAAKMSLAFARRLGVLVDLEDNRFVRFPRSENAKLLLESPQSNGAHLLE